MTSAVRELPEDVLKQIEHARMLRRYSRMRKRQEEEQARAEGMVGELPEGRGNPGNDTYVTAHPLEMVGAVGKNIYADYLRRRSIAEGDKQAGLYDDEAAAYDRARKEEEFRQNEEEAAQAQASGTNAKASVLGTPSSTISDPTNDRYNPLAGPVTLKMPGSIGPNPDPSRLEHPRSPVPPQKHIPFVNQPGISPTQIPQPYAEDYRLDYPWALERSTQKSSQQSPPGQARTSGWKDVLKAFLNNKGLIGGPGRADF